MEKANVMPNLRLNLVLLGKAGAGKSSSGNTILGREAFTTEKSFTSVTRDVAAEDGDVCGLPITVYDTPGFSGTENEEELSKYDEVLQKCESGLCAFLVVVRSDGFTEEEQKTVEKIEELLGEKRMQNTWILFTDELEDENKSINHLISETESLKKLTQKYEERFHVFNNKEASGVQVNSLISKVFQRNLENLPKKPQQRIPINIQDIPVYSRLSRRIVLLGKSGVGKSASGNTILGKKEFDSVMSASSVTCVCSDAHATVSGRSVSVVDTPGFFDTYIKPEEIMMEIAKSVYISSPGPHAFLIVLRVIDRFTEHELQIPQMIEMLFGQEVLKYSIILFTHGDLLEEKPIEELIKENSRLRDLVDQCGGRYHIFNNKDQNNREQVNDLLQKIDTMIEQNGGGHYSNQMYEDALRFRQEEEEQRQREEEERKQQVEKQVQEEIERVRKETEEKIRAEMEAEYERLKTERTSEEEQRKQEKQIQEEIDRKIKETEKIIRAELQSKLERQTTSQSGFSNFIFKYKSYFCMAAFVLGGMLVGAVVLAGVGAIAGAVVTSYAVGGGTLTVCGAALSASGVAAGGADAVAAGAGFGAAVVAAVGAVGGAAAGAVVGVAASEDAS